MRGRNVARRAAVGANVTATDGSRAYERAGSRFGRTGAWFLHASALGLPAPDIRGGSG